jgi:methylenetetrahydrofolate dehydrogenase (NADP+)/methenyltetrahydrofolate cyclohydrolase/formyltetrahydrofolate synthetase
MVAVKIDGTAIAKNIRERLGTEIAEKQKLNPRYKPTLKIIQGMSCLWPIRPRTIALIF